MLLECQHQSGRSVGGRRRPFLLHQLYLCTLFGRGVAWSAMGNAVLLRWQLVHGARIQTVHAERPHDVTRPKVSQINQTLSRQVNVTDLPPVMLILVLVLKDF